MYAGVMVITFLTGKDVLPGACIQNVNQQKKNTRIDMAGRGGARPGAGRKPITDPQLKKVSYQTKLPRWLVEWLREHKPKGAEMIEAALVEKYDLK